MLYLVSTPIGNLADMSFRAVKTLQSVDYVLCEDTRHSSSLLKHFEIEVPLISYHKFSESKSNQKILNDLKEGKDIALISDAGTPCICDPGQELIALCQREQLEVSPIPGCCAVVAAFSVSGFTHSGFSFLGFLPKKGKEQKEALLHAYYSTVPTIFYEAPHRIEKSLKIFMELIPTRKLFIAKEITKKFEFFQEGTAEELLKVLEKVPAKGEFILIVAANDSLYEDFSMSLSEQAAFIEETFQIDRKEAIKSVSLLRNLPKKEIYQQLEDEKV
ncbi:MAG: 16S rRNA (cytidine(1402)-2'-O)-methyltransferase [Chlamydiales bacterium]|nr:16S rRNA (cytidine(1402)-2'-O)-methyltransferase [Chlamydiales bacterium]